jgi:hypothetical protein
MIARFASSHQHSLNPGPCNVIFSRDQLQGSAVISETTPSPTRSFRLGVLFIPPTLSVQHTARGVRYLPYRDIDRHFPGYGCGVGEFSLFVWGVGICQYSMVRGTKIRVFFSSQPHPISVAQLRKHDNDDLQFAALRCATPPTAYLIMHRYTTVYSTSSQSVRSATTSLGYSILRYTVTVLQTRSSSTIYHKTKKQKKKIDLRQN